MIVRDTPYVFHTCPEPECPTIAIDTTALFNHVAQVHEIGCWADWAARQDLPPFRGQPL